MRSLLSLLIPLLTMLIAPMAFGDEGQEALPQPTYDPKTHTFTVEEQPTVRGPAPSSPIDYSDALKHWDGTGELLLKPRAGVIVGETFAIGATFDNSDAVAEEDADGNVDRRCPHETLWYRLDEGRLRLSQGGLNHGDQISSAGLPKGAAGITFATDRCRYHLVLGTKVRDGAGWVTAPEAPLPAPTPTVPIGPATHFGPGDTFVMKSGPLPQELVPLPVGTGMRNRLEKDLAIKCPRTSGMVIIEGRGVYFEQPWSSEPTSILGIRREEQANATALIFQNPECREEITVTREIKYDNAWRSSQLSVDPKKATR